MLQMEKPTLKQDAYMAALETIEEAMKNPLRTFEASLRCRDKRERTAGGILLSTRDQDAMAMVRSYFARKYDILVIGREAVQGQVGYEILVNMGNALNPHHFAYNVRKEEAVAQNIRATHQQVHCFTRSGRCEPVPQWELVVYHGAYGILRSPAANDGSKITFRALAQTIEDAMKDPRAVYYPDRRRQFRHAS